MPTSKKKRNKKHRPIPLNRGISTLAIEDMKQFYENIKLRVLIKLPFGQCSLDDMLCIRDLISITQIGLSTRNYRKEISEEDFLYFTPLLNHAGETNKAIVERGFRNGMRFVLKGDELKELREVIWICCTFILESIEECPRRLLKEWSTYVRYKSTILEHEKRISLDIKQLAAEVDRTYPGSKRLKCFGMTYVKP